MIHFSRDKFTSVITKNTIPHCFSGVRPATSPAMVFSLIFRYMPLIWWRRSNK